MANTIDKELYQYFMQLNEAEKKSVLQMLKTFLEGRKQSPVKKSFEEYNKEIAEAEAEYEKGEYLTHEEMVKEIKKW